MTSSYFDYGSCRIIFGPMFAGKTSKLCAELTECADIGLSCLYINHSFDERETEYTSDDATSHSSQFKGLSRKIMSCKIDYLGRLMPYSETNPYGYKDGHGYLTKSQKFIDLDRYDVIGIDEGQFFPDLVINVRDWVLKKNKRVIIASLDGNYEMQPIGHAHELICICDPGAVKKLGARCKRCMIVEKPQRHFRLVDAGFTMKTKQGNGQEIEVGGSDLYEAVCMKCHQ